MKLKRLLIAGAAVLFIWLGYQLLRGPGQETQVEVIETFPARLLAAGATAVFRSPPRFDELSEAMRTCLAKPGRVE